METFVWDPSLITGLPEVDEQHHELVDLFNELNEALFKGHETSEADLQQVFARLIAYAHEHFTNEEQLMRERGISSRHLQMHHQMHLQFVEQVQGMWDMRSHLRYPGETIMGFLSHWLGLHIMGVDQAMARQMALIAHGLSGEQAYEQETAQSDKSIQALLRMVGNLYHVLAEQNSNLAATNQILEQRVQERTQALQMVNADLQRANEQLQVFSLTDGLLGIPNRKAFDQRLALEVARAVRQRQPLGVLMLDVDYFKRYNDTQGHQAGDVCLQSVAQAVRRALKRETDFVARYGGEELVALLPDTDAASAVYVGQQLVDAVRAIALPHGASPVAPVVTVSIGVCSGIPAAADDAQTLLKRADAALYQAKNAGRNRVEQAA